MSETYAYMEGWRPLISKVIDLCNATPGVKIEDIKEKWGELRIYVNEAPAHVFDAIDEATKASTKTCMHCGRPAYTRAHHGWFTTLCDVCNAQ